MFIFDQKTFQEMQSTFEESKYILMIPNGDSRLVHSIFLSTFKKNYLVSLLEEESYLKFEDVSNWMCSSFQGKRILSYDLLNNKINIFNNLFKNLVNYQIVDINLIFRDIGKSSEILENLNKFENNFKFYKFGKQIINNLLKHNLMLLDQLIRKIKEYDQIYFLDNLSNLVNITNSFQMGGFRLEYLSSKFFKSHWNKKQGNIIHPEYSLYNLSGRLSSRSPTFNCLGIPKGLPRKEMKALGDFFLYFDYIGFESTLVLNIIKKEYKLETIKIKDDIYSFFQQEIFRDIDRESIKQFMNSYLYGAGDFLLKKYIPDMKMINSFRDHEIIKNFEKLMNNVYEKWLDTKFIKTPNGRNFKVPYSKDIHRGKIFNFYVKSTGTELITWRLGEVRKLLENKKSSFSLFMHDGFLLNYCKEDGTEIVKEMIEAMKFGKLDNSYFSKMYFPISVKRGDNFNL